MAFKRVQKGDKTFWTPCSPGDGGAVAMKLMDVPASELLSPDVIPSDFEAALEKVRPSVSPADLKEHEEFTATFGMEGHSFQGKDETCDQVKKLLKKYPDRIPVICAKAAKTVLPEIEKKKFLVPGTMLCGEFKYIIHKHIAATGKDVLLTALESGSRLVIELKGSPGSPTVGSAVARLLQGNPQLLEACALVMSFEVPELLGFADAWDESIAETSRPKLLLLTAIPRENLEAKYQTLDLGDSAWPEKAATHDFLLLPPILGVI
eukprot:g26487.t1